MRTGTLFLLLIGLAGSAVGLAVYRNATEESRAWRRLLSLEGRDPLPQHDPGGALFLRFGQAPTAFDRGLFDRPWKLFRCSPDTPEERVLLICRSQAKGIPGNDTLHITVVGGDRHWRSETRFSGGWRLDIEDVSLFSRPGESLPCLRVLSNDGAGGFDVASQYYALDRDRIVLVRLEGSDGRLRRNSHDAPNYTIGPAPDPRAPDAWARELASDAVASVLTALAYLGGVHFLPGEAVNRQVLYQSDAEIQSVAAARAHPGVRVRVMELRRSEDPWLREAAEAVPLDGSR